VQVLVEADVAHLPVAELQPVAPQVQQLAEFPRVQLVAQLVSQQWQ